MCFLRANISFLQQSYLSVAESGIWVSSFVVGRFNLRVRGLLGGTSYTGLRADLQSHYNNSGRRKPWEMSGLHRFAIKQVAKRNCTLRLTHGGTHWHKRDQGRVSAGDLLGLPPTLLQDLPAPEKKPSLYMKIICGKMVPLTKKPYFSAVNLTLRVCCI